MSATLSEDGVYRYDLVRHTGVLGASDTVVFVLLNPSTADASKDDPTVRRCMGYTNRWGYERLVICNLFAYRATEPRELLHTPDPVGPDNDVVLASWCVRNPVVVGWGNVPRPLQPRAAAVLAMLAQRPSRPVWCLGTTKGGEPRHPLYMRGDVQPQPYEYL